LVCSPNRLSVNPSPADFEFVESPLRDFETVAGFGVWQFSIDDLIGDVRSRPQNYGVKCESDRDALQISASRIYPPDVLMRVCPQSCT
jgi:hypothetical protein